MAALDNIASELLKSANEADLIYKKTRDQAQRDKAVRLRRIVENLKLIIADGLTPTLDEVLAVGNTSTNSLNVGGITSDYFQLDTAATPTLAPGMFAWNDAYGTADLRLKGNNVTLQLGQETLARVVNKTGSDLLESQYKVVRVRVASEGGAQGQRLAVVLAQGLNDPESATTLGIVTENIANNQEGFITVFGNVNNINTTGSLQGETWVDGDVLYLSPTTAGGLTKVKPTAPNHMVIIGYVVYAHANNGKIFVKVDNGYELDELHNVLINGVANNDLLQYDGTTQVWKNKTISAIFGGTPLVSVPTLAQVTTAGNTTSNTLIYTGTTEAARPNVDSVGSLGASNFRWGIVYSRGISAVGNSLDLIGSNINLNDISGNVKLKVFGSTTGNVTIQNGGTHVDAGYRLDVNGTTRFTGDSYIAAGDFLLDNNRPIRWKDSGGTSRRAMLITAANDFQFGPVDTGWGATTYVKAGGALQLVVNGVSGTFAAAVTINTSSNVGIGTTSPNSKLDVVGSFSLLGSSGGYWLKGLQGNSAVNGTDPFLALVNNNSIASATFGWLFYDSSTDGSFNLYRRNNSTTGNQVYTISRSTGNFLINTTTDAGYKLNVNGTVAAINGDTTSGKGAFVALGGAPTIVQRMQRTIGGYAYCLFEGFVDNTSTALSTRILDYGAFGDMGSGVTPPSITYSYFGVGSTAAWNNTYIRLYNSVNKFVYFDGNVGIGSTTDAGYKLDVTGTFRATGAAVLGGAVTFNGNNFRASTNEFRGTVAIPSTLDATNNTCYINIGTFSDGFTHIVVEVELVPWLLNTSNIGSYSKTYVIRMTSASPGVVDLYASNVTKDIGPVGDKYQLGTPIANASNLLQIPVKYIGTGSGNQISANIRVTGAITGNIDKVSLSVGTPAAVSAGTQEYVSFRNRIGIGTTSPSAPLHVASSITASSAIARGTYLNQTLVAAANNDVLVGLDIAPTFATGAFTGVIQLAARFGSRVHISNNNVLSIGGNTVSNDTAYGNGYITSFNQSFTINGSGGTPYFRLHHTTGNLVLQNGGTFTDAGYRLDVNGTARIQSSLTVDTDTLFVDATNNRVGIGTTTPGDKLSIVDGANANIFGRITANGTNASAAWVAQNDQTDNVVYRVFGSAVTGSQMGISLARSASLMANLGGGVGKFLIGSFSSSDVVFGTSNTERMRIVDNTGDVLIGTTTDLGNMLEVAGVINSLAYSINNVPGYTGTLNIPGNPPGQQNIDIQSGIITNIF